MKGIGEFLIMISPAIAGGIARYFHDISKNGHIFKWKRLTIQIIIAGIVGWWTVAITNDVEYFMTHTNMQGALVGISSFLSPNILELLEEYVPKLIRKKVKKL